MVIYGIGLIAMDTDNYGEINSQVAVLQGKIDQVTYMGDPWNVLDEDNDIYIRWVFILHPDVIDSIRDLQGKPPTSRIPNCFFEECNMVSGETSADYTLAKLQAKANARLKPWCSHSYLIDSSTEIPSQEIIEEFSVIP